MTLFLLALKPEVVLLLDIILFLISVGLSNVGTGFVRKVFCVLVVILYFTYLNSALLSGSEQCCII